MPNNTRDNMTPEAHTVSAGTILKRWFRAQQYNYNVLLMKYTSRLRVAGGLPLFPFVELSLPCECPSKSFGWCPCPSSMIVVCSRWTEKESPHRVIMILLNELVGEVLTYCQLIIPQNNWWAMFGSNKFISRNHSIHRPPIFVSHYHNFSTLSPAKVVMNCQVVSDCRAINWGLVYIFM